jgi:hypothetical protein
VHERTVGRSPMNRCKIITSLAVASGLFVLAPSGAEARILCEGNYQIVNGLPVGTPYCRDLNLTNVARSYGWKVSFDAIRYSDSTKAQVCRAIGHDNRVQEACAPYRIDGGDNKIGR